MKLLFAQSSAQAQAPTTTTAPDDRSTTFRPVQSGEMQSGEKLLVEAYAAIWLLVFALVFATFRKQRKMDQRIQALEESIEKARRQGVGGR